MFMGDVSIVNTNAQKRISVPSMHFVYCIFCDGFAHFH